MRKKILAAIENADVEDSSLLDVLSFALACASVCCDKTFLPTLEKIRDPAIKSRMVDIYHWGSEI